MKVSSITSNSEMRVIQNLKMQSRMQKYEHSTAFVVRSIK